MNAWLEFGGNVVSAILVAVCAVTLLAIPLMVVYALLH